jgi:hypothetical protein
MTAEKSDKTTGGVTGRGFRPGQSGNPGGRPKKRLLDRALKELLEADDSRECFLIARRLISLAKKGNINAIKLIAERTEGRPFQAIALSGSDGGPMEISELSPEQIDNRIRELLRANPSLLPGDSNA